MAGYREAALIYTPDYKLPDGWTKRPWKPHFPDVFPFEEIGIAFNSISSVVQLLGIAGKDQLAVPSEYKKMPHTSELLFRLTQLIGSRFDPLYNLVKIRVHNRESERKRAKVAALSGAVITLSTSGFAENPIGAAIAGVLIDRAIVSVTEEEIAVDKKGDEGSRIGPEWDTHLLQQVEEVARQVGLSENDKQQLTKFAFAEVIDRHKAFYSRFIEDEGYDIRSNSGFYEAIEAGADYYELTGGLGRLSFILHPFRYATRRSEAHSLKEQFITYVPQEQKYMTIAQLREWLSDGSKHPNGQPAILEDSIF